ncbi:acyl carrier protein [Opitutus sp. ER46]|uniref:acyl carrier protein n=1 Tax=Opitutus sp. ER46 TaxID=2161864 RepID=UPI001304DDC4|nr:acyl carrier protein [Opitutus sp. ER46]
MPPLSEVVPAPRERAPADPELSALRDTLKRCSPSTIEAACLLHRTGDMTHLKPVLLGVVERYVENDRRARVRTGDDQLRLVEDLGIDSLTMLEIVVLTEEALHISISNEELTQVRTLGDVRRFLATKVETAPWRLARAG